MKHTINNATVRNAFIALLSELSAASRATREANSKVREFVAKHKLTPEQAKPYVMRHCANIYGVPMFEDELRFVAPEGHKLKAAQRDKLPKAQQHAIKNWMAAKDLMRNMLAPTKPATPVKQTSNKVDPVEKEVADFYKSLKALSPAALKIVRRETGLAI